MKAQVALSLFVLTVIIQTANNLEQSPGLQ